MRLDTKILAASVTMNVVLGLAWLAAKERTVIDRPDEFENVGKSGSLESLAGPEQVKGTEVSESAGAGPEDLVETERRLRSLGLPERWVCAALLPEINDACMRALVEGYANMLAPWERVETDEVRRSRTDAAIKAIKEREALINALWGDQGHVEALQKLESEVRRYAVDGGALTQDSGDATARIWALNELSEEEREGAIQVVRRGEAGASGDQNEGAPYVEIEGRGAVYVRSAKLERLLRILFRYELHDQNRFKAATDMLGLLNAARDAGPEGGTEAAGQTSLARIRELYGRDIAKDVERNGFLDGE